MSFKNTEASPPKTLRLIHPSWPRLSFQSWSLVSERDSQWKRWVCLIWPSDCGAQTLKHAILTIICELFICHLFLWLFSLWRVFFRWSDWSGAEHHEVAVCSVYGYLHRPAALQGESESHSETFIHVCSHLSYLPPSLHLSFSTQEAASLSVEAGLGGGRSLLQVRGGHKERGREREKQRRTQERAETYPPVEFKVESQIPEQDFDSASLNHFIFVIVIIYSFELFFLKAVFCFTVNPTNNKLLQSKIRTFKSWMKLTRWHWHDVGFAIKIQNILKLIWNLGRQLTGWRWRQRCCGRKSRCHCKENLSVHWLFCRRGRTAASCCGLKACRWASCAAVAGRSTTSPRPPLEKASPPTSTAQAATKPKPGAFYLWHNTICKNNHSCCDVNIT